MAPAAPQPSFLATRRGKLTLALLAAVAFLDFVDASIVNIALPSIRRDLHFSVQGLLWVPSAYLLTYGGFMLLGGRAADLLGRRRVLVAGALVLGIASLIGGFARDSRVLSGARLARGLGAALLLVFALVKAPDQGWGSARTIGELAGAGVILTVFVLNELRSRNPLLPLSIFRVRGLAAADLTQFIAFAGFVSMFFFVTLYMQN